MSTSAARRLRCWAEMLLGTAAFGSFYFLVPMNRHELSQGPPLLRAVLLLASLLLVTLLLAAQVRRSLRPDRLPLERLSPLLGAVNLVVVFFALIYYGNAEDFAGLETRLDALYFTVTTLCTVGYGDIVPLGPGVRAVATIQMIFDLVIVTTAISLIVNARPQSG
ncbi:potassium channel family protein [Actinocorallia populi]|uniref:potassium channel family protein n=1 Tax=Actinocorallia populi TaxID=2079200 RepID=UPI000D0956E0|nr:potassium channel family protein [Actinocorallia populi]